MEKQTIEETTNCGNQEINLNQLTGGDEDEKAQSSCKLETVLRNYKSVTLIEGEQLRQTHSNSSGQFQPSYNNITNNIDDNTGADLVSSAAVSVAPNLQWQCYDPNCSFWQRVAWLTSGALPPFSEWIQASSAPLQQPGQPRPSLVCPTPAACCLLNQMGRTQSPSPLVLASPAAGCLPGIPPLAIATPTTTRLAFARRNSSHLILGSNSSQQQHLHQPFVPHLRLASSLADGSAGSIQQLRAKRSPSDQSLASQEEQQRFGCSIDAASRKSSLVTSHSGARGSDLKHLQLTATTTNVIDKSKVEEQRENENIAETSCCCPSDLNKAEKKAAAAVKTVCEISVIRPSGRKKATSASNVPVIGTPSRDCQAPKPIEDSAESSDDSLRVESEEEGNESDDDATNTTATTTTSTTDDDRDASSSLRVRPASACTMNASDTSTQSIAPREFVSSCQGDKLASGKSPLRRQSDDTHQSSFSMQAKPSRRRSPNSEAALTSPVLVGAEPDQCSSSSSSMVLFNGRPSRHQSVNEREQPAFSSLFVSPPFFVRHQQQNQNRNLSGSATPPQSASQQSCPARRLGSHSPSRFNFAGLLANPDLAECQRVSKETSFSFKRHKMQPKVIIERATKDSDEQSSEDESDKQEREVSKRVKDKRSENSQQHGGDSGMQKSYSQTSLHSSSALSCLSDRFVNNESDHHRYERINAQNKANSQFDEATEQHKMPATFRGSIHSIGDQDQGDSRRLPALRLSVAACLASGGVSSKSSQCLFSDSCQFASVASRHHHKHSAPNHHHHQQRGGLIIASPASLLTSSSSQQLPVLITSPGAPHRRRQTLTQGSYCNYNCWSRNSASHNIGHAYYLLTPEADQRQQRQPSSSSAESTSNSAFDCLSATESMAFSREKRSSELLGEQTASLSYPSAAFIGRTSSAIALAGAPIMPCSRVTSADQEDQKQYATSLSNAIAPVARRDSISTQQLDSIGLAATVALVSKGGNQRYANNLTSHRHNRLATTTPTTTTTTNRLEPLAHSHSTRFSFWDSLVQSQNEPETTCSPSQPQLHLRGSQENLDSSFASLLAAQSSLTGDASDSTELFCSNKASATTTNALRQFSTCGENNSQQTSAYHSSISSLKNQCFVQQQQHSFRKSSTMIKEKEDKTGF